MFFKRIHDPIAHARRARCQAYVGSIFNECVNVIVLGVPPDHHDVDEQIFVEIHVALPAFHIPWEHGSVTRHP